MGAFVGSPKIIGDIEIAPSAVKISRDGRSCEIESDSIPAIVIGRVLQKLDGSVSVEEVISPDSQISLDDVDQIVEQLDQYGMVDDIGNAEFISGRNLIRNLEIIVNEHCERSIYVNPFWEKCLSVKGKGDLPEKLATGMVIENWHFLFRESYFDAPVLSFVQNTAARLEMNKFFSEEYGHDEILLRTLNFVGLTREDMRDAIPLPETMALCNGLAYWAHTDPMFFFTTLGLLEGQALKTDSFIDACERAQFPEEFVAPLKAHSNINVNAGHGNLTREIFAHFPVISKNKADDMQKQVPLFVELYNNFYNGVWRYYTSDKPLLRRTSAL